MSMQGVEKKRFQCLNPCVPANSSQIRSEELDHLTKLKGQRTVAMNLVDGILSLPLHDASKLFSIFFYRFHLIRFVFCQRVTQSCRAVT